MQQLFSYFFQLCLLRADPAQTPRSIVVLSATVTLHAMVNAVAYITPPYLELRLFVPEFMLGLLLQAGLIAGLLYYRGVPERLIQTMTALLATSAIVNALFLPFAILSSQLTADDSENGLRYVFEFLTWFTFVWWVAVTAYILQRAANIHFRMGACLAVFIQLIYLIFLVALRSPA